MPDDLSHVGQGSQDSECLISPFGHCNGIAETTLEKEGAATAYHEVAKQALQHTGQRMKGLARKKKKKKGWEETGGVACHGLHAVQIPTKSTFGTACAPYSFSDVTKTSISLFLAVGLTAGSEWQDGVS